MQDPKKTKTELFKALMSITETEVKAGDKLTPYARGYHDALRDATKLVCGLDEWASIEAVLKDFRQRQPLPQLLH